MAPPRILAAAVRPFAALFRADAFEGVLLIAVAALALALANSPVSAAYHALFHTALFPAGVFKLNTLHLWVNDALMAVFFFVVGLEVKRELIEGTLSDPAQRTLPVLAAAAGMAAPALVYLAVAGGVPGLARGWAIPAATDIAFAMGVVGLLGTRVPSALRLFLLTVAIVDDIGAVLVIAIFYTASIKVIWLAAAAVVLVGLLAMNRAHVDRTWPYIAGALLLWLCVLQSGVHATIAGVLAAFTIPMLRRNGADFLEDIEHALLRWNARFVVPLFGFANAGVDLRAMGTDALLAPLPLAVAAGLVIGKQAGIFAMVFAADRTGIARRPEGCSWLEIWGVAMLCGIGFTMSLFIGELAFPGSNDAARLLRDEAKVGILAGSLLSALLGYGLLRLTAPRRSREEAEGEGV